MVVIFFFLFGVSLFLQLFAFFSFSNLLFNWANFDMKISFSLFSSGGGGFWGFCWGIWGICCEMLSCFLVLILNLNPSKNVPIGPGVVGGVVAS